MILQNEVQEDIKKISERLDSLRGYLDVDKRREELQKIEKELLSEEVWTVPDKLKELQKKKADILENIGPLESALKRISYLQESVEILDEDEGEIFFEEIRKDISGLKSYLEDVELRLLLSGEADRNNAIVTIHPGAGGVESQDWAQMLMRMYLRWAEMHGYKTEIADLQIGDEAGIKGATFTVEGQYAYGYLKAEAGIHRLVRISPFDANKRRHTSFAAVLVYPEIEDNITVDLKDEDLKIDTFRSSGAGGQHVNKVSSAVRITHIPTGIIVACQSERSQLRNKELALKIVRSRIYDMTLKSREKKLEGFIGDKKEISWGNQIRSYTLQPYRLVKDHRTNVEIGDVDSVLDGKIDSFVTAYLKSLR
ncbi:MAG TPA: peptide chain release factor 2 [Dissulfurispiraceae bacterium]|nr:peptide chain release factor 2 [Dissulfurispiraceae bacterium]